MGKPIPLDFAPGIVKVDAPYALPGRYIDCDKVRFVKGKPEKHKGFEMWSAEPVTGIPRAALAWDDFSANRRIAVGTHTKLMLAAADGTLSNITPFRESGTLANDPFAVTIGSALVIVTDVAHGLVTDGTVNFSGASAGGGITINGEYTVTAVIDVDHYEIVHSAAATSTDATTGGAAVLYDYEIAPGNANVQQGDGWGVGTWGTGTWGTPREDASFTQYSRTWSLDLYGQNLLAMPSGLNLYQWIPGTSVRAAKVANSPTGHFMFVSNERFPIILGADDNLMQIAWPSQTDITDWTTGDGKTVIFRNLQGGSRLICGAPLRALINLVWSDTSLFLMQYTGYLNQVYSTPRIETDCGIVGPHAFAIAGGRAYWMGTANFLMYAGSVAPIPNSEDIRDWLYARLDAKQNWKCQAHYSSQYNEVTWFYIADGDNEASYYVAVALDDFTWTMGTSERVLIEEAAGISAAVYGLSPDGDIFEHEIGVDADGAAMAWFLESAPLDMQSGDTLLDIHGIIPNFQRQTGAVEVTLTGYDAPQKTTAIDTVSKSIAEGDGIKDCNMSGRQVAIRYDGIVIGSDFRLGMFKLEVQGEATRRPSA